jgi:hypothetical protein
MKTDPIVSDWSRNIGQDVVMPKLRIRESTPTIGGSRGLADPKLAAE